MVVSRHTADKSLSMEQTLIYSLLVESLLGWTGIGVGSPDCTALVEGSPIWPTFRDVCPVCTAFGEDVVVWPAFGCMDKDVILRGCAGMSV